MILGGGGRKGNKEGNRGKGHRSPLERHLEFEEGSLRERGDDEGVTWKEESKVLK